MLEKKKEKLEDLKTEDVDNLTVSIMTKNFNKSFSQELLPEQADLLKEYIFAAGKEDEVKKVFESYKSNCLNDLENYSLDSDNDFVNEKIDLVKQKITNLPTENINDQIVSRYLTVMKLSNELRS